MITIGPIAAAQPGRDETSWGDEDQGDLRQIFISHGEWVDGIQFEYVKKGNSTLSAFHGVMGDSNFTRIKINYPSEYLIGLGVSISHCPCRVSSLTFFTNQRTLGPHGSWKENAKVSEIALGAGRHFRGFHGRAGDEGRLTAIGVYIEPLVEKTRWKRIQLLLNNICGLGCCRRGNPQQFD